MIFQKRTGGQPAHPSATEMNYSDDEDVPIGFYQENSGDFTVTFVAVFNNENPGF
jgi:hypothetical protein